MGCPTRRIELDFECDEPWEAMRPVPGGRHCARCDRDVVDLSRLREKTALAIVERGEACVSFLATARGEPIFRADPRRVGGTAIGLAAGLLAACARPETVPPPFTPVLEAPVPSAAVVQPIPDAVAAVSTPQSSDASSCVLPAEPEPAAPPTTTRHRGRVRTPRPPWDDEL